MATLPENDEWVSVYQLEPNDPVVGGAPNEATGAGMDNIPHLHLAKRTRWLKTRVDTLLTTVVAATTLVAGIVRLNTSTNSTSTTEAATPSAVKAVADQVAAKADAARSVTGAGLATGGGDLSANRVITVPLATQAVAEAGTDDTVAMSPLKTAQAIIARLTGRSVLTSGLATGGGTLAADRTISVPDATQVEAEAGAITTTAMSPLRVAQAISARLLGRSVLTSGLATGGGNLSADRTINVPVATQAQAEAGTDNATAMTPLRVAQLFAAQIGAAGYQAASAILSAISALATTGLIVRTGAGAVAARTITAGTGITVTNGNGAAGNPTIAVTGDLPWLYESTEQTITLGGALVLAHGLGREPRQVQIMMRCAVAEAGYAVGDTVFFGTKSDDISSQASGPTAMIDAGSTTTIRIVTGGFAGVVANKTTGARALLTAANWRYIVRAR